MLAAAANQPNLLSICLDLSPHSAQHAHSIFGRTNAAGQTAFEVALQTGAHDCVRLIHQYGCGGLGGRPIHTRR